MRVLNIKEIQQIDLDILKDVDAFCRSHGIRYAMAYGTLLGAVRHKGFIPWDDDIDIVMRRDDYERFRREYKSERYRFFCRETEPECWVSFGRVADCERTKFVGTIPWHSKKLTSGAWIDVFPMDFAPDDEQEYLSLYRNLNTLMVQSRKIRGVHSYPDKGMSLRHRFKILWKRSMHSELRKKDPSLAAMDFIAAVRKLCSEPTGHVAQLCCPDSVGSRFDRDMLDSYVDLPFEDCKFMAPARYREFLEASYGRDYMSLPPKSKRVPAIFHYARVLGL